MKDFGFNNEVNISLKVKKPKRIYVLFLSLLIILILGIADYISGYEMSFSIFYLIPISLAVIFSDFKTAFVVSIFSAAAWFFADIFSGHKYQYFLTPYWNALMRFGYFILHSFFLSKFLILYNKAKIDSFTDPLTGIYNIRYFYELFERELKKAKRAGREFTLIYIDLDNFKKVNDSFGHLKGDLLLQNFSNLVVENIRSYDIFARAGGDEFLILLPETDFEVSNRIIIRIKELTEKKFYKDDLKVTLSIGAITFKRFDMSIDAMINEVDNLMYNAKEMGKNKIEHIRYE